MMNLHLNLIVAELNNIGVGFQEANQLDEAFSLYRDAAHAMSGLLDLPPQTDGGGSEERDKFCEKWQAKLMEWRKKPIDPNTSKDGSVSTVTSNLHVVEPYGQDISSFSKAHLIDIHTEVSRELASLIIMFNMALANSQRGALMESLELFQLTLSMVPNEIDPMSTTMSLTCIAAQYNLGLLLNKLKRRTDALEVLADAAKLGGTLLGDHVVVANTLNALGQVLSEEGNSWEAMEVFHLVATLYDRYDIVTVELSSQRDGMESSLAPAA